MKAMIKKVSLFGLPLVTAAGLFAGIAWAHGTSVPMPDGSTSARTAANLDADWQSVARQHRAAAMEVGPSFYAFVPQATRQASQRPMCEGCHK